MKKAMLFALVLSTALVAGPLVDVMTAHAQGGAATENGDVNGDGDRDISDALYLLGWLFIGGPPPVALAQSPELEARLTEVEAAVAKLQVSQPTVEQVAFELAGKHADALRGEPGPAGERGPAGEPGPGADPVAAAAASLALLLDDAAIAAAVPAGALQPVDSPMPLALLIDGSSFGEVAGAHIDEEVSRLSAAHVAVRIDDAGIDPRNLVEKPAVLAFRQKGLVTYFGGEIVAAGLAGRENRRSIFRISIAPRLHRLQRTRRSRVFEGARYSDIVTQVLEGHGISPIRTAQSPLLRETVFQYNETDFNFVSRMLEEEGIYYYFEHGADGDRLGMAAGTASAPDVPGVFSYLGHEAPPPAVGEAYLRTFLASSQPVLRTVQVRGWDPEKKAIVSRSYAAGAGAGAHDDFSGERRIEEVDLEARIGRDLALVDGAAFSGTSTIPVLRSGHVVTVNGIGGSFDGRYFVTSARHTMVTSSDGNRTTIRYGNSFRAIPVDFPFRPERRTPLPRVQGHQTALVVAIDDPEGLGRIRVKFPWLDDGAAGGGTSGWMRIMQPGAGPERGFYWLPEIEDEVLVGFSQGDINRPVAIGGLWNGKDNPPEAPTATNDRRVIKSRSGNKLIFDDTRGAERVTMDSVLDLALQSSTNVLLRAPSTQVEGVLSSSRNADPGIPILPGERHRDNSIVAWARVPAIGGPPGDSTFGVGNIQRYAPGAYRIVLTAPPGSFEELIPIAVPEVPRQPVSPADVRFASVRRIAPTVFDVYINSGTLVPAESDFVFMVTAR